MISVRYTKNIEPKLPSESYMGSVAKGLAQLYLATVAKELPEEIPTTHEELKALAASIVNLPCDFNRKITHTQAKVSTNIRLAAAVANEILTRESEELSSHPMKLTVAIPWPYEDEHVQTEIDAEEIVRAMMCVGIKGVKVPLLRILQLSAEVAKKQSSPTIANSIVIGFLSSYYSSFDERFQMLFYPSPYRSLMSKDAAIFELSSLISESVARNTAYSLSATSVWLNMNEQEPIPSLLKDFLVKSGRSSLGRDTSSEIDEHNPMEDEDIPLAEMCHRYLDGFLPMTGNIDDIETQQPIELVVADSITHFAPAATDAVVLSMMINANFGSSEIDEWLRYCRLAKEAITDVDSPIAYYPDYVVLSANARRLMMRIAYSNQIKHRTLMGGAAFVKFLDESLQGGAPDSVVLHMKDICAGSMLTGDDIATFLELPNGSELTNSSDEDNEFQATAVADSTDLVKVGETPLAILKNTAINAHKSDSADSLHRGEFPLCPITPEELSILMQTRRLSNFDVPLGFQRLILAHMMIENRATVSMEDLIGILTPSPNIEAAHMLANTIDPFVVHAGVDEDAAIVLAMAEILQRRALTSLPMSEESANRIYGNMLVCAISAQQATDDECCEKHDSWIATASRATFDPRIEVAYLSQEPKGIAKVTPTASRTQNVMGGNGRIKTKTANMSVDEILEAYTHDMVAEAREERIGMGIVGRDEEIELVETILARKDKSNPLLLAPAGAGKTALVEAIARRIATGEATLPEGMTLRSFDLIALTSDGCAPGVMADRLERICNAAAEVGAILFIDEIHMINSVGSGDFNAANILKPCLAREGLHVIGATTEREYNYSIARDKALARRFSPMHLHALEFSDIVSILEKKAPIYGAFHDVEFDESKMALIALLAQDYMGDRESPDRELDILDTAASVAAAAKEIEVSDAHIIRAVKLLTSNRTVKTRHEIAKELTADEYTDEELDNLFPNVAGQISAKRTIANRINESKLDISVREKPRNIFMFVGESGVGKTYMAGQMAPLLDAEESDILYISLGEYNDQASFTRLIGASPQYVGYNEGGVLTNFVKAHPGGIIVLDEMDKGYSDVQDLFLGVFDTGVLRAGDGSIADCKSCTFVCTANTGFGKEKKNTLGFASIATTEEDEYKSVEESLKNVFGEPLISRIDSIVVFDNLSVDDLVDLCKINYTALAKKLEDRYGVDIKATYTDDDLERDARERFKDKTEKERDARTAWADFEKEIIPKAIALL